MQPMPSHPSWTGTSGPRQVTTAAHRLWLLNQANALFSFFQHRIVNPRGGFSPIGDDGLPLVAASGQNGVSRHLHETTRMVHCFAGAHLLGIPGADQLVDHGMDFLWTHHRDSRHGGYYWAVDDDGPVNSDKLAYGHAFVILAAASAKTVGHPDADRLLADGLDVLETRFWDRAAGATTEEYRADWSRIGDYRGQNSNMHLTEALMAAHEATGDNRLLAMAESIAALIINRHARAQSWRVAEHFTTGWDVDLNYEGDPMFRPRGTTPGHALEWSRLLVQLWELGGRQHAWMIEAAKALFFNTVATGWNNRTGGFYYTLTWDDRPDRDDLYWWPCAEGIGAAAVLGSVDADSRFEEWYRRIWGFAANHLIDHKQGGWIPELDADLKPVNRVFTGRPDLYHAVQACLIPLFPATGSFMRGLAHGGAAHVLNG